MPFQKFPQLSKLLRKNGRQMVVRRPIGTGTAVLACLDTLAASRDLGIR